MNIWKYDIRSQPPTLLKDMSFFLYHSKEWFWHDPHLPFCTMSLNNPFFHFEGAPNCDYNNKISKLSGFQTNSSKRNSFWPSSCSWMTPSLWTHDSVMRSPRSYLHSGHCPTLRIAQQARMSFTKMIYCNGKHSQACQVGTVPESLQILVC